MSIDNDIEALLANIDKSKVKSAMTIPSKVTDPMVTIEDVDNPDPLTRCIKLWFLDSNLSISKFKEAYRDFYARQGIRGAKVTSDCNNALGKMCKDRITWRTVTTDILPILGLCLENIELTAIDANGRIIKINLNDLTRRVSGKFPNVIPGHELVDIKLNVVDENGQRQTIGGNDEETRGVSNN
jgi:hypothetical protein